MRTQGKELYGMAGTTGLEPATSDVTGRRSNQLNYVPALAELYYRNTLMRLGRRGALRVAECPFLLDVMRGQIRVGRPGAR